ncbi:MAG: hypothetical protein Q7W30_09190 [Coriobacteriia bacterium]|nr:hypothetical protein [Coriobacteriia bacterium]
MRRTTLALAIAAALLALPAPTCAIASVGVASDIGRITLPGPVRPGQRVTLQAITITNSGTEPTVYRMFALGDSGARPAEPAWFTFEPEVLTLAPNEKGSVTTVMSLPADLEAGEYRTILVARPIAAPGGGQYNIAAGPRLRIEVAPASWIERQWFSLVAMIQRSAPWSYLAAIAIVAIVVVSIGGRARSSRSRRRSDGPPVADRSPEVAHRPS